MHAVEEGAMPLFGSLAGRVASTSIMTPGVAFTAARRAG
jgi:hypothetical protein